MDKKILIYDLDETLCEKKRPEQTYSEVKPIKPMIEQLNRFYDEGNTIIIQTARNMVTQGNDVYVPIHQRRMETGEERYISIRVANIPSGVDETVIKASFVACLDRNARGLPCSLRAAASSRGRKSR